MNKWRSIAFDIESMIIGLTGLEDVDVHVFDPNGKKVDRKDWWESGLESEDYASLGDYLSASWKTLLDFLMTDNYQGLDLSWRDPGILELKLFEDGEYDDNIPKKRLDLRQVWQNEAEFYEDSDEWLQAWSKVFRQIADDLDAKCSQPVKKW